MTIVKRIVERHNGKVRLESESGKGSSFYITLSYPDKTNAQKESEEQKMKK